MPFAREDYIKRISDGLNDVAAKLKSRSRVSLTDANHSLETVMQHFLTALFGWSLTNLNAQQSNYPAVDLADFERRWGIQITNEDDGGKITGTKDTAVAHGLGEKFTRIIIFFLLPRKPKFPRAFVQPDGGPTIETWDIPDVLKQIEGFEVEVLKRGAEALERELKGEVDTTPLNRYFVALKQHFSTYENLGLPTPGAEKEEQAGEILIGQLFVAPTCTPRRVSPEEFDRALAEGSNPAAALLPLLAELGQPIGAARRTVLLADPGMGKSTVIQWLIATLAGKDPLPPEAEGLRGAIPLPFVLRDLVKHLPRESERWDWPALRKAFCEYRPGLAHSTPLAAALIADEAYFESILESDRALFLIDGLDEIGDPAHRRALRDALWDGFDRYRTARWLVTSRVVGYEQAPVDSVRIERDGTKPFSDADAVEIRRVLKAARIPEDRWLLRTKVEGDRAINTVEKKFARVLYLAPFDDTQQEGFALNWYRHRLGMQRGKERALRFLEAVRQHPAVRVIGRVPNLLYLLALLYRHRAHLPHGRAHVYAAISEAYLEGISLARQLEGQHDVPYKLMEKTSFLAVVAWRMQDRRVTAGDAAEKAGEDGAGEVVATREELEKWLAPHFPGEGGCEALHRFLDYVAARSGLLLPRGEGVFAFAHLSFLEYYAACWLEGEFRRLLNALAKGRQPAAGMLQVGDFQRLGEHPLWREPLIFLAERLSSNPYDVETLLGWLFPQVEEVKEPLKRTRKAHALMPLDAARLLAAFSLDPQVAMDDGQRRRFWNLLWKAQLVNQFLFMEEREVWNIAPALLQEQERQGEVIGALQAIEPKILHLSGCTGLRGVEGLGGLTQLQALSLRGCIGLREVDGLGGLTQLERLDLRWCTGLRGVDGLGGLTQLGWLALSGCTGLTGIEGLGRLKQLQLLDLSGCTQVPRNQIAALRIQLPHTQIIHP